ncbi:MAG: hypothetical protein KC657_34250 [Myxococcales bacterium]|nr:hypothetical protein [Myxococcales bacterium]
MTQPPAADDPAIAAALERAAGDDVIARALAPVLALPTGKTSAGFPYLGPRAWQLFRDGVPHLLGFGGRVLDASARLVDAVPAAEGAARVVRQVVLTAAITAPPDLWLTRHVLAFLAELGLLARLADGELIDPEACDVTFDGERRTLHALELEKDLMFLLSRGMVEEYEEGYRIAGHPRVREIFTTLTPRPAHIPASTTASWRRLLAGEPIDEATQELLLEMGHRAPKRVDPAQNHWVPDLRELELGRRLVPVVLGARAAERTSTLVDGAEIAPSDWNARHVSCAAAALEILTAAGWTTRHGERYRVTTIGARGFARGPGPFGIIETYHPYMDKGRDILLHGPGGVWVERGENVGASQDANRATFKQANDALDRFCEATGFTYRVFIEHAIGRGEATRQRFARSGATLTYVGADLEDAAIDAGMAEQARGALPAQMMFVRKADIGKPEVLLAALSSRGVDPRGAVMLVGNGFHEVRGQTDEGMVEVFRGYHAAGILLLFTEENALSIDDLRATAYNTYHAGFRYVHDKSGQALRPAHPRARPPRLGHPLRAAWSECARRAGYVRADAYCTRTRTVYPYPPRGGHNPSISVNHFFVPAPIAASLGVVAEVGPASQRAILAKELPKEG